MFFPRLASSALVYSLELLALEIRALGAKMAACRQPSVVAGDLLLLSTLVQTRLQPSL